jgi:hypothetical protein
MTRNEGCIFNQQIKENNMGQLAQARGVGDIIENMADLIEHCLKTNKPAADTIEAMAAQATLGPIVWPPLAPPRYSFGTYYLALANALLFVSEEELVEIRRAKLSIRDLLISIRARWSHHQHAFNYSVIAGIQDGCGYTTAGIAHDKIQAEMNGDPVF